MVDPLLQHNRLTTPQLVLLLAVVVVEEVEVEEEDA